MRPKENSEPVRLCCQNSAKRARTTILRRPPRGNQAGAIQSLLFEPKNPLESEYAHFYAQPDLGET